MIKIVNWFTKITAYIPQKIIFRTKYYYEDKKVQSRRIKGPAIIVSNHTALFDYAIFLFTFFGRTLRYQMAEVLFRKKWLGWFLSCLGGIKVDREVKNFAFIQKSEQILEKGGVVGVFPESRLPKPNETRPLEFKTSVSYLALSTNVPIIPVYTNGSYFKKKRARVMIGKPIYLSDFLDESLDDKQNLEMITKRLREEIIRLGEQLNERQEKKKG